MKPDYFDFARTLSREQSRQEMESLEPISPAEHAEIERMSGRKLTTEEAQIFWRTLALEASFYHLANGKKED